MGLTATPVGAALERDAVAPYTHRPVSEGAASGGRQPGDDQLADTTSLGELIPGLEHLPGVPDGALSTPVATFLGRRGDLSWAALAVLSPAQLAQVPNLGPIRIRKLVDELRTRVARMGPVEPAASVDQPTTAEQTVLAALREVATWAVGTGQSGSLLKVLTDALASPSLDEPSAHIEFLANLEPSELADSDASDRYDPVAVAQQWIDSLDEREQATLDRLLDFDGSAPTRRELGDRFGVTRERVRQVEVKVEQRVLGINANPAMRPLLSAAVRLRGRLGAATPSELLVDQFAKYPPDLIDRLLLHLAGPYRFDGEWFVLSDLGRFTEVVPRAFESVAEDGIASRQALLDSMVELGFTPEHAERAVHEDARFREHDDAVFDWRGSLASKVVLLLQHEEQPMPLEEIAAFVEPQSERSMTSQVYTDDRLIRVGQTRYGLARWGLESFPGIEPTLAARLADGPLNLQELSEELAQAYGVSAQSVHSIASSHPGFLVRSGVVSLRPDDEPYVPSAKLETTRGCYLVDGLWAWRTEATRDLLRGVGPRIPEAFAVHLGCAPLSRGSIQTTAGTIGLSWGRQPAIGSLRAAARSLDAEEGDWLFVRRVRPSEIDFLLVRAADLGDDPERRLRALIGAGDSTAELEQVLADALGMRGSVNHDLTEERAALVARREHDLVELLDASTPAPDDQGAT